MAGAYHYNGEPWRPGTNQVVAYTGTAGTISNAVGSQTRVVRVVTTTAAYAAIGTSATTTDVYMPAGVPEYFLVTPGEKISAVQVSSGGNLHVTEMTR